MARMSVELVVLGLWTAVTLLAVVSAVYLVVTLAPDRVQGWHALLRGRTR